VLSGVRVLLVDDEPDARKLVSIVLTRGGAEVIAAASAAEAIELLQRDSVHVLLSDIGMPAQDGYELIRHVRRLPPERGGRVPAAALTAFARAEDRRNALNAGYQLHVAKPVDAAELIAVVASLAGRTTA
jgi:CheY-like chemotaxis protein